MARGRRENGHGVVKRLPKGGTHHLASSQQSEDDAVCLLNTSRARPLTGCGTTKTGQGTKHHPFNVRKGQKSLSGSGSGKAAKRWLREVADEKDQSQRAERD